MTNKRPMHIKVPGKLMVAGEFAVLVPHQKLVVMAVDRFVHATIEESIENQLILKDFNLHLKWKFRDGRIDIDTKDKRVNFVKNAMDTAYQYLHENLIPIDQFSLTVKSELDDRSGRKYGLGSSAAVVTAVITAILSKFLPEKPSKDLIFKLSAITHVATQGNGSGADIAASTYGGVLQYTSFQDEWLLNEYEQTQSITELVKKDWTYLSIRRLKLPENIWVCIGWTGKPASTANLVEKVLALKATNKHLFQKFLTNSQEAVNIFLEGIEKGNIPLILKGITLNRQCLAKVGRDADAEIETPLLGELSDIAEELGGAGKLSGAGGGDCGIAFMPTKESAKQLVHTWENRHIKPLDISIYNQ